jgi:hypothetical protein
MTVERRGMLRVVIANTPSQLFSKQPKKLFHIDQKWHQLDGSI